MSHLSKIFEEAPIRVQNRNGFDLSHVHSGTSKCGQLVPVLTKLLAPNTTISLGVQAEVNMPPFVAPWYGKVDFAIEGFVVPCSILYGGWKQFISNQEETQFPATQAAITSGNSTDIIYSGGSEVVFNPNSLNSRKGYAVPYYDLFRVAPNDTGSFTTLYGSNDNVYEYMGLNVDASGISTETGFPISLMPALAYHKIVDTFYRNTKLTKTWFAVNPTYPFSSDVGSTTTDRAAFNLKNVSLIWHSFFTAASVPDSGGYGSTAVAEFDDTASLTFPDSVSIFSTRQRTYMRDYFTSAVYSPQQGGASKLIFSVDVSTPGSENGSFTINSLRMANSLQKFLETNNLSGDYAEMVRNRWGTRPIDADFEEPHYLGRVVIPVYQHTINKQDALDNQSGSSANFNPFVLGGYLGAQASNGGANGEGSICDNFNVSCWSYLMCIASLYPHANYNQGINKELCMTKLGDFPAPELQSVGMEEIKNWEIAASVTDSTSSAFKSTFGYIPRYSFFKYILDHSSGELRPGETLQQYQLQRIFSGTPSLGTNFVTIPQDALDPVLTVSTSSMKLTCWWEIYFKFKVVMPLADFCIPTLGELQDTHTIKTTVGGSRL